MGCDQVRAPYFYLLKFLEPCICPYDNTSLKKIIENVYSVKYNLTVPVHVHTQLY